MLSPDRFVFCLPYTECLGNTELTVMHNKISGNCCNEKQKERIASEKCHVRNDTEWRGEELPRMWLRDTKNGMLFLEEKYKIICRCLAADCKADCTYLFNFWLSSMQDLSSLTRDQTHAPCNGSKQSQSLGYQGIAGSWLLLIIELSRNQPEAQRSRTVNTPQKNFWKLIKIISYKASRHFISQTVSMHIWN